MALSLLVPRAFDAGLADRLAVGDDRQDLHGRPRQAHRPWRIQVPLHRRGHVTGGHQPELVAVAQQELST
jgi:hypothetical protein